MHHLNDTWKFAVGANLNLPPFLRGKSQLSADKVKEGHSITSLRIHVECAIGRIKHFQILTGTIRLKMARILDQIVTVCAYLSNFHPPLVPTPEEVSEPQASGTTPSPPLCTANTTDTDFPYSLSELNLSSDTSDQSHSSESV